MRELSLFTGGGGGVLGTHHLLGWRTVGYVEFNEYAQKVIAQRIKDGALDDAPIFTDIRAFIRDGYAASYSGLVDCVTAGFPCQPFSSAGLGGAEFDPRNMWPATIEAIRIIRPKFAFLENVAGLLTYEYFGTILADLAASGFDARWRCLSAAELGMPHKRDRVWIVAHAKKNRWPTTPIHKAAEPKSDLQNTCELCPLSMVAGNWVVANADGFGMDDGMAFGVEPYEVIGNGQVPIVAATAWRLLSAGIYENLKNA